MSFVPPAFPRMNCVCPVPVFLTVKGASGDAELAASVTSDDADSAVPVSVHDPVPSVLAPVATGTLPVVRVPVRVPAPVASAAQPHVVVPSVHLSTCWSEHVVSNPSRAAPTVAPPVRPPFVVAPTLVISPPESASVAQLTEPSALTERSFCVDKHVPDTRRCTYVVSTVSVAAPTVAPPVSPTPAITSVMSPPPEAPPIFVGGTKPPPSVPPTPACAMTGTPTSARRMPSRMMVRCMV